jgi:hypothetical protein
MSRMALLGAGSGGGSGLTFLLRDDFTTAASAPLASPRSAEPGPGTLTLVQTDGQFSISSAKLSFPVQTTPAWGDLGFHGASQSRIAGRAVLATVRVNAINTYAFWGWDDSSALSQASTIETFVLNGGNSRLARWTAGSFAPDELFAHAATTDYQSAIILRGAGAYLLLKGGVLSNWTLVWVSNTGTTTPLYPVFNNFNTVGTLDLFRVLDLAAPFDTDYGLATQRLSGSQSAGQTFTHEANCVLEYVQTTMPSGGGTNSIITFRRQDDNNRWAVGCNETGALFLLEYIAGVQNIRGLVGAVMASGHRVVVVADGSTIRVYTNNVLRITYTSASNFATMTAGKVETLAGSSVVSDIVLWPRQLGVAAAALLDLAVA